MRTAQWTFFLLLATLLSLAGLQWGALQPDGPGNPAAPGRGALAPVLDPPPPLRERARLSNPPGQIVDLDANDQGMAVLARNGWTYRSRGTAGGWYGEETPGAPRWLSRPESIALSDSSVFILEPDRSILSVWDTTGVRLGEIPIPIRRDMAQRATRVIVGPSGDPVVVLQGLDQDGTAFWEIVELDGNGRLTGLVSLPNQEPTAIFQEPQLAAWGEALLAMSTLSQNLWAADLEHNQRFPVASRESPPFWALPQVERRKHDQILSRMSRAMAARAQLPEYWPSVREFTVRDDGTILQSTATGETTIQIEMLDPRLHPLGRANKDGFKDPVFLAGGRAFLAREQTEETIIYEIRF